MELRNFIGQKKIDQSNFIFFYFSISHIDEMWDHYRQLKITSFVDKTKYLCNLTVNKSSVNTFEKRI